LTLPGSKLVRFCLPIPHFGEPVTPFIVNDDFLASLGILSGMVLVGRGLRPKEVPEDGTVCVVRIGRRHYAKRLKLEGVGSLLLENDKESKSFDGCDPAFRAVALYACSCELRGTACVPVPLSVQVGLAMFRSSAGMMRWETDAHGHHGVSDEMRGWISFLGGDPDAWAGWGWIDFLHPDDRDAYLFRWSESIETGKPYLNQGRICIAGMWLWMAVSGNPIFDSNGQITAWEGFLHFEAVESRKSA
jgi:PAS domain-containing protein